MSNYDSKGIYGIYCKDADIYSKTLNFTLGLIGSVLAEDNSSVVLYNTNTSDANYIEAHTNSNVFLDKLTIDENKPTIKSENNAFVNFPLPIYDINNVLANSTGFDTSTKPITDFNGKATSILANNGFEYYLTKIKNGIFLSDINITTTDYKLLKNYLDYLPRNLNGFNLNINIGTNLSNIDNEHPLEFSYFYGGLITLTTSNTTSISALINCCENVILSGCSNVNFDINFTSDVHLVENTDYTNVFFNVCNSNIFGDNVKIKFDNNKINNNDTVFKLTGSKCFLTSKTTLSLPDKISAYMYQIGDNSQATWLPLGTQTNLKEYNESISGLVVNPTKNSESNIISEVNHQHVYAELDSTTDEALNATYIGYPIAWVNTANTLVTTDFFDTDELNLLIPIPPTWRPVLKTNTTKKHLLSDVTTFDSKSAEFWTDYILGDQINFYMCLYTDGDSDDNNLNWYCNIKNINNILFKHASGVNINPFPWKNMYITLFIRTKTCTEN